MQKSFFILAIIFSILVFVGCTSSGLPSEGKDALSYTLSNPSLGNGVPAQNSEIPTNWEIESAQKASAMTRLNTNGKLPEEAWCVVINPPILYTDFINNSTQEAKNFVIWRLGAEWGAIGEAALSERMESDFIKIGCSNYSQ